ncbi:MAG: hypothetical protein JSU89_15715 [Myxococcales bacterium]|nr:MAG: hypothetical protein JSU89_15715 [Myxococcales bacterium]
MSTDLLRVEPNQRVDHTDFDYMLNESMTAAMRDLGENFLLDPDAPVADRVRIIDGFAMTNPSGKQLTVTLGRALLAERVSGVVQYGALVASGDATQTIDMAPLASNTYGVYIRFEYVDAETGSRVFWNPSGAGSEFTQSIPTRRVARWSMRVELASPGAEWLQIGTADNSGGSLVIVDQRDLYFEGPIDNSYQSGWSSDGGGIANDRNADRKTYGVTDLQTFTSAMRQCLEDIKGRGLRRWWDRDIGGLNVGFDADPSEDTVAIGDQYFNLNFDGTDPTIQVDDDDWLWYDRSQNAFRFAIGTTTEVKIDASGLYVGNGLYVGDTSTTPTDNDIYAAGGINCGGSTDPTAGDGIFTRGVVVGFDGAPADDELQITDSLFRLYVSTDPFIYFDANDFLQYDRSANDFLFKVGNSTELKIGNTGLNVNNGIFVGDVATDPTDNELRTQGDIHVGGLQLYFGLASDDYIEFSDTTNYYSFWVDAAEQVKVGTPGVQILTGLHVGDLTTAPTNDSIKAVGSITGNVLIAETIVQAGTIFQFTGANDYFQNVDNTQIDVYVNNVNEVRFTANGLNVLNGIYVGTLTGTPTDNDIYAQGSIACGTTIDASGDATFGSITMTGFDVDASGNCDVATLDSTGAITGSSLDVSDGTVTCGRLLFHTGGSEYIDYDATGNYMTFTVSSAEEMRLDSDGLRILNGLYVGSLTGTATDNDILAEGDISAGGSFICDNITDRYLTFNTISGTDDYWYLVLNGQTTMRGQYGTGVDNGVIVYQGLVVGDSTPPAGYPDYPNIWCYGDIIANQDGTGDLYASAGNIGYWGGSPIDPSYSDWIVETTISVGWQHATLGTDEIQIRLDSYKNVTLKHDGTDGWISFGGSTAASTARMMMDSSWSEFLFESGSGWPDRAMISDRYGIRSLGGFHKGGEHLTGNMLGERDGTDWVWAYNNSGVAMGKGEVVMINGNSISRINIKRLDGVSSSVIFGVTMSSIANNDEGRVAVGGLVKARWGTAVYTQYGYRVDAGPGGTTYLSGTASSRGTFTYGIYIGGAVDTNYGWVYINHGA